MGNENELLHGDVTERLIRAFYLVYRELGYGFQERVYQKSMMIEGHKLGLEIQDKYPITVHYKGNLVGHYEADLVANGVVIVELKTARELCPEHEAQLLNYLRATPFEVGLLLNFGPQPQHKRKIFQNDRKGNTDMRC